MTPSERIELLLPWINGEPLPQKDVQHQLVRFLGRFVGVHLRTIPTEDAFLGDAGTASTKTLAMIRARLRSIIDASFPNIGGSVKVTLSHKTGQPHDFRLSEYWANAGKEGITSEDTHGPLTAPSLTFGVRPAPKSGGSDLYVTGKLVDLVPFLFMHLLTAGQVVAARCMAPAPGDWSARCGRLFVSKARGRPRTFCSDACKTRHHDQLRFEEERRTWKRPRRPRR